MSIKSGLQFFIISVMLSYGLGIRAMAESRLLIEMTWKSAPDLLDAEISGSLINKGDSPIDVTVSSASFPFEVELLDKQGIDVLAKHRKPSSTIRRSGNATQTIHLESGEKKVF